MRPVDGFILIKKNRFEMDMLEAQRYPTDHIFSMLYNVEFCEVLNPGNSKFKVGDKLFFNKGLSYKVEKDIAVIFSYRIKGYYEGN